ncbi:MAG: glycosyltransferase [Patescibacteria group bacterium]|nr:glycosyltransferase [Patescibacteria group bacterium]MDE2438434.1 glycosyltransferase [Patescibacteria group bacterium]
MDAGIQKGLVSVIIPTYNNAEYIADAIDSVCKQTYKNYEIIVIDDGSSDFSEAVIRHYHSSSLYYERIAHEGVSVARNVGVQNAHGEFVAFLDADDIWFPEKLEIQLPVFQNPCVGLVYSDMEFFGNAFPFHTYSEMTKHANRADSIKSLLWRNYIGTSSVLMRREVFDKAGGFPVGVSIGEDYLLWLSAFLISQGKGVVKPLVRYRIHDKQSSRGRTKNYKALFMCYRSLLNDRRFRAYWYIVLVRYLVYGLKYSLAAALHL